jgi:hypothetical protein
MSPAVGVEARGFTPRADAHAPSLDEGRSTGAKCINARSR